MPPSSIPNPRRVLAISHQDSSDHLSRVLTDLTGSPPPTSPSSSSTLAGATHNLELKTPYYNATVPCWIDLIADSGEWASQFLSEEAKAVLGVIGGVVLVFEIGGAGNGSGSGKGKDMSETSTEVIRSVGRVVQEGLGGWEWEGVGLAVGVGTADEREIDEWDGLCADVGLEFVQVTGKEDGTRNELGEKTGIPRVKEALETNDWADPGPASTSDFGDFEDGEGKSDFKSDDDDDSDLEDMDFGLDKADMKALRNALLASTMDDDSKDEDEEEEEGEEAGKKGSSVKSDITKGADGSSKTEEASGNTTKETSKPADKDQNAHREEDDDEDGEGKDVSVAMEQMMSRLQVVRDAAANTASPEQRRKMAATAVASIMKELDSFPG